MNTINKRIIAAFFVFITLAATAAAVIIKDHFSGTVETEGGTESFFKENYFKEAARGCDLVFWYDDKSYAGFFLNAAETYYEKSGILVKIIYRDSLDYVGDIYKETIKEGEFPDLYLLSGEQLKEAYFLGLARSNEKEELYREAAANNAVQASMCQDKMIGYPLSYNVCLFAYNNVYFENPPESIQAVIDFANENEPPENVQYLLEWDVNDPFYDFPFVSCSVLFTEEETGGMAVHYHDALYTEELAFLEASLELFSIQAETVSEESVEKDLVEGTTLCAIVDSDSFIRLRDSNYSFIEMPRLNDALSSVSCALTDLVIVNDYSFSVEEAERFAEYVTLEFSKELYEDSGHYSVKRSENPDVWEQTAYQAYEHAVPAPDSREALGFWVSLKEAVSKLFRD